MRRIWAIFLVRKLTGATALRTYTLLFLALESKALFSVRDIFANMPSVVDISRLFIFYSSAFAETDAIAQTVLAGMVALGGFSAWRTLRYLARTLKPAALGQYA